MVSPLVPLQALTHRCTRDYEAILSFVSDTFIKINYKEVS